MRSGEEEIICNQARYFDQSILSNSLLLYTPVTRSTPLDTRRDDFGATTIVPMRMLPH
jgi:hypothetical protein